MDKIIRVALTLLATMVLTSMFFTATDRKFVIVVGIFVSLFISVFVFYYKKTKLTVLNIMGWTCAIVLGFGHIYYLEHFFSVTSGLGGLICIIVILLLILHKPKRKLDIELAQRTEVLRREEKEW